MIELTVPGPVQGKGRPRFARGRTYTPKETVQAEKTIREEWVSAGEPKLEGPLKVVLILAVARPKGHWNLDGALSAAGRRSQWPMKRPDLDNALKLALDSLNGGPYVDDAQIVDARVVRRWANPGESEHTRIVITPKET